MIVVINPLLSLLNKDINIDRALEKYVNLEYTSKTQKDYKLKNVEVTEKKV